MAGSRSHGPLKAYEDLRQARFAIRGRVRSRGLLREDGWTRPHAPERLEPRTKRALIYANLFPGDWFRMDFLDIVKGRRSIRRYLERKVPPELLEQVLEAVRWAPSGGNLQPWEVVVVTDVETKRRIQETLGEGNPARRAVVEAPVLLVLCGKVEIPEAYQREATTKFGSSWFLCHVGIAAQNLCLAAHGLGLGTIMVGFFDHDQAASILQVPEGYEAVLLIPLGYPAKVSEAPPRRTVQEFRHDGSFGAHREGK